MSGHAGPRLVFMFSGQGSQYHQMGRELYDTHEVFRQTMQEGERLVRRRLGRSLLAELYGRDRSATFDDLRLTHPALLMIGTAIFRTLCSEGIEPDAVWGSSLGEFIAAVASGSWSFAAAMDAVMEHARLVTRHCAEGGMLAVLGDETCVRRLCADDPRLTLAGQAFSTHFTLAGTAEALDAARTRLDAEGVPFQRLAVRYAFHSSAVDPVESDFIAFCGSVAWSSTTPTRPILSGLDGTRVDTVDAEYLWRVIRQPMRFAQALAEIERGGPSLYIDCGPSGTMATFARYAMPAGSTSSTAAIVTPFAQGVERIAALKQRILAVPA